MATIISRTCEIAVIISPLVDGFRHHGNPDAQGPCIALFIPNVDLAIFFPMKGLLT
jgi:hypothetical protein